MNATAIVIDSSNPDYDSNWYKKYVEEDIRALGRNMDWIEYVIEQVFEGDLPESIFNAIVNEPTVRKIVFDLGPDNVTITKLQ